MASSLENTARPGRLEFPTSLFVAIGGVIALGVARCVLVERVERTDAFAGRKVLDLNKTFGHIRQALRKALGTGSQTREIAPPTCDHGNFKSILSDCGRGQCRYGDAAGAGKAGVFQNLRLLILNPPFGY